MFIGDQPDPLRGNEARLQELFDWFKRLYGALVAFAQKVDLEPAES